MSMSPNMALSIKDVAEGIATSGSAQGVVAVNGGGSVPARGGCRVSRICLFRMLRSRHRPFLEWVRGNLALRGPDNLRSVVTGLVRFVAEVGTEGKEGGSR